MDEKNKVAAEIEEIDEIPAETDENVSRETKTAENSEESAKPEALWSGEYVLTEDEMRAFVDNSGLVASKRKITVQATLAAVLCVINAISYATGDKKMALFLAIVCAALCGAVIIVPIMTRKHLLGDMKVAADQEHPTRISGDGTSLFFGAGEDVLSYPYDKAKITVYGDVAVVALADGQMVCVPRRALNDAGWDELCAHAEKK